MSGITDRSVLLWAKKRFGAKFAYFASKIGRSFIHSGVAFFKWHPTTSYFGHLQLIRAHWTFCFLYFVR
jgi:hypothetical protein